MIHLIQDYITCNSPSTSNVRVIDTVHPDLPFCTGIERET